MRNLLLKISVLFLLLGGVQLSALDATELSRMIVFNNFDYKLKYSNSRTAYVYTNRAFKKYNYRYKIVAVDTRYWTKNKKDILKKRAIISKFGRALGKKAIVQNFIMKTSKKRAYLRRIQKELGTNYNLNKAPFFIFFKKGKRGYRPYKIISLASLSAPYLKQELALLGKAINHGKSSRKVYANLNKVKKKVSAKNKIVKSTQREKRTIHKLIDTLKGWFS